MNWKEKLDAGHSGIKGVNMEVFKVNTCSSPSWVNGSTKGLQGLGYAESHGPWFCLLQKILGGVFWLQFFP